jgi:alkylhydroperoxidase/carboxymuconolactone decarboxylase family protein YurZ
MPEKGHYKQGKDIAWQLWGKGVFDSKETFFEALEQANQQTSSKFMELALFSFTNYASPVLDLKTRCLIQVAVMTALGQEEELQRYIMAALNIGVTEEQIMEAIDQLILYCGLPRARAALSIARKTFAERRTS